MTSRVEISDDERQHLIDGIVANILSGEPIASNLRAHAREVGVNVVRIEEDIALLQSEEDYTDDSH